MPDNSHLDVQIGRLDERFKALEKKVDAGNVAVLAEIKDLKDNFASRLERVEVGKLGAQEFIRYRAEQAQGEDKLDGRLRAMEDFISNLKGKYAIIAVLGMLVVGIIGSVAGGIVTRTIQNDICPASLICTVKE